MKAISVTFDYEIETWDDPGDYPNAIAAGPLPSYDYVGEVNATVVLETEDDDEPFTACSKIDAEYLSDELTEALYASGECPSGISGCSWLIEVEQTGKRIVGTLDDCDSDDLLVEEYDEPEYEYDPDDYADRWP